MSFTDFMELEILDHILGPGAYTAPGTVYVGLSTTAPTDAGGSFTEPVGGSYARAAVVNNSTQWPAAASGSKTHANAIVFATATGSWGTITNFAIFDALSGGNMLMYGALSSSKLVANGDTFQFNAGAIIVTLN
jgi:hypothetical protein